MRSSTLFAPTRSRPAAAALALAGLMLTVHPAPAEPQSAAPATHTAATELQWIATPVGPEASPVSGDFSKGSHITFLRFPAGTTTPLHTHTASYVGIVITGTTRHWLPGRPETEKHLPPGSHWSISAGTRHVSECLPGLECLMAVFQEGAFDFLPAAESRKTDGDGRP